jgi:hypothetical protein
MPAANRPGERVDPACELLKRVSISQAYSHQFGAAPLHLSPLGVGMGALCARIPGEGLRSLLQGRFPLTRIAKARSDPLRGEVKSGAREPNLVAKQVESWVSQASSQIFDYHQE